MEGFRAYVKKIGNIKEDTFVELKLKKIGIDGVFTDYPARLKNEME